MGIEFVIYQDRKKEFRWRAIAANNKIIADGGEGYKTEWNCKRAVKRFIDLMHDFTHEG